MSDLVALELCRLTDEELAGIDIRPDSARLVVYPYLDQLAPQDRDQAIAVALRGMAAHGLISAPDRDQLRAALGSPGRPGTVDIEMDVAVSRVLELRVALRVICAQRMLGGTEAFCYLYFADEAVLEEFVDDNGLHAFRVHKPENAADVIALFFNPTGADGTDGDPIEVDARAAAAGDAPNELLEQLGRATCSGEFFMRHMDRGKERPAMLGIFSGPDGIYFSETQFGSAKPVEIAPVSAATLRERIKAALP